MRQKEFLFRCGARILNTWTANLWLTSEMIEYNQWAFLGLTRHAMTFPEEYVRVSSIWHTQKKIALLTRKNFNYFYNISLLSYYPFFLNFYFHNIFFKILNSFTLSVSRRYHNINLTKRSSATTLSMLLLPWRNFYEKMQVHCGIDTFYILLCSFQQKIKPF